MEAVTVLSEPVLPPHGRNFDLDGSLQPKMIFTTTADIALIELFAMWAKAVDVNLTPGMQRFYQPGARRIVQYWYLFSQ